MMGYWGGGPGYAYQSGRGYGNLTQEQRTQLDKLYQKFFDETANLREILGLFEGEVPASI